nr:hypothetical protein Iba_chr11bCG14380 [Ipomoea batatas]
MVKDRENASRYPVLGTKDNRGFCSTISDDQEDQVGKATSTGESPATEVGTGGVRRDGGLVHGKARTGVGEEFTSGTTTWSGIGGAFTGGSSAIASISAKKSRRNEKGILSGVTNPMASMSNLSLAEHFEPGLLRQTLGAMFRGLSDEGIAGKCDIRKGRRLERAACHRRKIQSADLMRKRPKDEAYARLNGKAGRTNELEGKAGDDASWIGWTSRKDGWEIEVFGSV